jgi:hypothetical protein
MEEFGSFADLILGQFSSQQRLPFPYNWEPGAGSALRLTFADRQRYRW